MSQTHPAYSANGSAVNGRSPGDRTVDWTGYPALFQRVAPAADRAPVRAYAPELVAEPAVAFGRAGGVREAFLGLCQAALSSSGTGFRGEPLADSVAAARAIAAAEAFGFAREEIRRLGCGLYPGPAAVREHLRGLGFAESEIDAARVMCDDAGRPRAELAGCFVVPLTDETGRLCDFLLLTVDGSGRGFGGYRYLYGPAKSNVVAFGLHAALSRPTGRLVLVDDVLEVLLLQCRGLTRVAAVGGPGQELSPRRWEELARLGVASVTLAFRRDERHTASVRDALVGALRARTAPEVCVANPYPGGERSAADALRRFGAEACGVALESRSLAFHGKDFGAEERVRPAAEPVATWAAPLPVPQPVAPAEPHHRAAYRRHLADLASALPVEDRKAAEEAIEAVGTAIQVRDYARAAWLTDGGAPATMPAPAGWFWATWAGGYAVPRSREASATPEAPSHPAAYAVRATPAVGWFVEAVPAMSNGWSAPAWGTVAGPRPHGETAGGRVVLAGLREWVRCERAAG